MVRCHFFIAILSIIAILCVAIHSFGISERKQLNIAVLYGHFPFRDYVPQPCKAALCLSKEEKEVIIKELLQ